MDKDNLTLYGITDEMALLDEVLEASDGEITEDYEKIEGKLAELLEKKVDGTCGYVQRLKDLIDLAEEHKARLDEFIKQKKNRIERLTTYVDMCLKKTGQQSFEGTIYEIKARKPSLRLVVQDESSVPTEYIKIEQKYSIDKAQLKKDVKSGKINIEGISLESGKPSISFSLKKETKRRRTNEQSITENRESDTSP